jgi:hypothetical protein
MSAGREFGLVRCCRMTEVKEPFTQDLPLLPILGSRTSAAAGPKPQATAGTQPCARRIFPQVTMDHLSPAAMRSIGRTCITAPDVGAVAVISRAVPVLERKRP